MGSPRNITSPDESESAPEMSANVVLLPAPFGPISPRISRGRISNDRSLTATNPSNCLRARFTSSSGPFISTRSRVASGGASGTGCGRRAGRIRASHAPIPSRANCSNAIIKIPNTTISKFPDRPSTLGSRSCSISFNSVITVAPITAPHTLPAPPTTAMNKYSMP